MVAPTPNRAAKVVKEEHLNSLYETNSITGGGEFQRRFRNDYSKKSHADYEASVKESYAMLPAVSVPRILGGVRES